VLLSDVIARGLDPLALRFTFLENRYRSQMDLSWASLDAANTTIKRWRTLMADAGTSSEIKFDQEISDAFTSDLDTPRAMQRLRSIEKDISIGALDKRALFLFADQVLGLDLDRVIEEKPLTPELQALIAERAQARADKDWAASDAIRKQLDAAGIEVQDAADGQSWRWK
jgi:cysteinyl-tRNA synthetase